MKTLRIYSVGFACLFASNVAFAQNPPGHDVETSFFDEAKDLMRRGVKLQDRGEFVKAYPLYVAALALQERISILANLASVEIQLRKYRDAAKHLNRYLELLPGDSPDRQKHLDRATAELAEARKHLLALRVSVSVDGADVLVDGQAVGRSPLTQEILLDPGPHEVVARYGALAALQSVAGQAGDEHSVSLTIEVEKTVIPPAASPPPQNVAPAPRESAPMHPPPPVPPPRRSIVPVLVGGGLALVGLTAGVGFSLASRESADETWQRASTKEASFCGGSESASAWCAEQSTQAERTASHRNWATAGFVVAGAATVATATYWFWPSRKRSWNVGALTDSKSHGVRVTGSF